MNQFIMWDDEVYSVGIKKIDDQHKQLVALINALHSPKNLHDKEFIEKVFNTLVEYTKNHFKAEERLLEKLKWDKMKAHHEQHENFVKALTSFRELYVNTKDPKDSMEKLTVFLRDWLTRHILIEDMAYANFLETV